MRRILLSTPSPPPTGVVAHRMRCSLLTSSSTTIRLTPAPSLTRAVAPGTRRKFYNSLSLLLIPTTLVREIIILFGIYMSFSILSIYLYKATIKKYIFHLYKATNSNQDKSYYSLLSSLWLNFKISPTKVDGEWSN